MRYRLITETKFLDEYGNYTAYGIEVIRRGQRVLLIGDISTDRDKLSLLVDRFNNEGLELSHLEQAIEEFLYDFEV